jgi:hypothetical protein
MAVVTGRNSAGAQRHRSVRVPGIYAAWHRGRAEAQLCGPVEREYDPRFDPDDMSQAESAERDAEYRRAIAEAKAAAESVAAQRIAEGKPITGTLLSPGIRPRNVPLLSDPDVMVDIDCDDRMSVNVAATAEYKAKRKAEDARRATVANRNGFNGTERNGYAVTTLAEGIS